MIPPNRRFCCALLTLAPLLLCFTPLASHGAVIFTDFGPGDSYATTQGWVIGGPAGVGPVTPAMPFDVSGGSCTFGMLELAAGRVFGTNRVDVSLMDDAAGVPGTTLESFTFTDALGPFGQLNPLLAASSVLRPTLLDGHRYWLEVVPGATDTFAGWNLNGAGMVGGAASQGGGPWTWVDVPRAAFRISGAPIPEPPAGLLVAAGLGLLGAFAGARRLR